MAFIRQYRILNVLVFVSVVVLCCLFSIKSAAQNACSLYIVPTDSSVAVRQLLKLTQVFDSKETCLQYVTDLPALLRAKGYLSASVDSVREDTTSVTIKLFAGKQYTWNQLYIDDTLITILNRFHYAANEFHGQPYRQDQLDAMYGKVLDYWQNKGYPFAKAGLDSLVFDGATISARLHVDKSVPYYIDSIHITGGARLSKEFIHRYLDIAPHELYNAGKLDNINTRLAALSYVHQVQPWSLQMLNDRAILHLYLAPKESNAIDIIAGFLPSNKQTGGKLLVTGQATVNLKNAFATGETIGIHWQQLQARSPRLNVQFRRPYLFRSPLGADVDFEVYKRDSLFVNVNAFLGLHYVAGSGTTGTLFLQTISSRQLSVDTNNIILTKRLPETSDLSSVSIGIDYRLSQTDYVANPRRGNEAFLRLSAGSRRVQPNTAITGIRDAGFNYSHLYDTVKMNSYRLKLQAGGAHYVPLGRQSALKGAIQAGWLQSPQYYLNELFQIGGFRLLRGFDEESIYANRYAVATAEYRYLLAQRSYFYVFVDGGYAHYQTASAAFAHGYAGAGFGLAFETKTGIFNISYAAGKRDDAPLDLRQSKIHLGFVTLF